MLNACIHWTAPGYAAFGRMAIELLAYRELAAKLRAQGDECKCSVVDELDEIDRLVEMIAERPEVYPT